MNMPADREGELVRTVGDFISLLSQYPSETPLVLDLPACRQCGRDGYVTPNAELLQALPTDVEGCFGEFRLWHGPDTPTVQVIHLSSSGVQSCS